jgi:hypothetical protein
MFLLNKFFSPGDREREKRREEKETFADISYSDVFSPLDHSASSLKKINTTDAFH